MELAEADHARCRAWISRGWLVGTTVRRIRTHSDLHHFSSGWGDLNSRPLDPQVFGAKRCTYGGFDLNGIEQNDAVKRGSNTILASIDLSGNIPLNWGYIEIPVWPASLGVLQHLPVQMVGILTRRYFEACKF
jgi:hypothetical protein